MQNFLKWRSFDNFEIFNDQTNNLKEFAELINIQPTQQTPFKSPLQIIFGNMKQINQYNFYSLEIDEQIINEEIQYEFNILQWNFKIGDKVQKNQILAKYIIKQIRNESCQTQNEVIQSDVIFNPFAITIIAYIPQNKIIKIKNEENKINYILFAKECKHNAIKFNDLCSICGDKIYDSSLTMHSSLAIADTYNKFHTIQFHENQSKQFDRDFTEKLLEEEKLLLILDLDNTLVHSIQCLLKYQLKDADLDVKYIVDQKFPDIQLLIKLRPHLKYFFQQLNSKYKFYFYTMGNRQYAEIVCKILNEQLKEEKINIKSHHIVSRDDNFSHDLKALKRIVPYNEYMVLILDDRTDVWQNCKNLIETPPFIYFNETKINNKEFQEDKFIPIFKQQDHFLHFATQNLIELHQIFYELKNSKDNNIQKLADTRNIYNEMKLSLFQNVNFMLSGIIDHSQPPAKNKLYCLIMQHGGKIIENFQMLELKKNVILNNGETLQKNINEQVLNNNIVVAKEFKPTKKIKKAKIANIPIVHYSYINYCISYCYFLDTNNFNLLNWPSEKFSSYDKIEEHIFELNFRTFQQEEEIRLQKVDFIKEKLINQIQKI